jgi:hypothetical protein
MAVLLRLVCIAALAALAAAAPHTLSAQTRTVMVVADHRDPSSVAADSDIFRNAYAKIADQLRRRGLQARAVSEIPSARRLGGKIERNMALAVEAARNATSPISVVLGVRIYTTMHRGAKGNSFKLWIDGEARDVALGKVVARHEHHSRKRHDVEKSCGRDCMLERAVETVGATAEAFGAAMAEKLAKR